MFLDVQPTSELAYSQTDSLEILDPHIDKMNPTIYDTLIGPKKYSLLSSKGCRGPARLVSFFDCYIQILAFFCYSIA